ncbi:purine nucleoside permease [Caulobacter sp. BP25]|uniref:purine-nucleoside phosphorylase n=1 Tax=Caulobacter sp. BP25 TaxID=2048900 RepID=UPI000C12C475|nr:purine nucleoside permease [Caulobacter sp. BP25]PHY21541.1 purine nucleoside permease [Caulobacter sp. BP25]
MSSLVALIRRTLLAAALAGMATTSSLAQAPVLPPTTASAVAPIPIRVVVVTAYALEDKAWMAQAPQTFDFPNGVAPLGYNPAKGVLIVRTGVGTNHAAITTFALGTDPRFDLSKAYWVVAAIAGVNPDQASPGSAAWIGNVIDVDFGKWVDPREAPAEWTGGYPPFQPPRPGRPDSVYYPLNIGLRDWAYELTKATPLPDTEALRKARASFSSYPNGYKPPFVLTGDEISGQAYWHGAMLTKRYAKLASDYSGGKSQFVMTAMEDTGVANALRRLTTVGKADYSRLLVLRTASNYSQQAPGENAVESMNRPYAGVGDAAAYAAHALAGQVVDALTANWSVYRDTVPSVAR